MNAHDNLEGFRCVQRIVHTKILGEDSFPIFFVFFHIFAQNPFDLVQYPCYSEIDATKASRIDIIGRGASAEVSRGLMSTG